MSKKEEYFEIDKSEIKKYLEDNLSVSLCKISFIQFKVLNSGFVTLNVPCVIRGKLYVNEDDYLNLIKIPTL